MKHLYILLSLFIILSVILFSLYIKKPKIVEVEKIIEIEKIVYVDKKEFEFINFHVDKLNINKILKFYQYHSLDDYETILEFYDTYTKNRKITEIIIKNSLEKNLPVNLMFALARRESGFNPKAERRNADKSWDRGLFQLNSKSRTKWPKADFFNIEKNTHEATGQMQWLLSTYKQDELALAAYNAGYYSIKAKQIPYITFIHVIEIKQFEREFDIRFSTEILPNLNIVVLEPGKIELK